MVHKLGRSHSVANALSQMLNLIKQKGVSNQTMDIIIFYNRFNYRFFLNICPLNFFSIKQSKAKKKASLESFMFFFGIGTIISSRSRPIFEALP
jgi:hypothetical protein